MSRLSQQKEQETEISLQMAPMINVMLVTLAAFEATAGIVQSEKWLRVPVSQPGSQKIFEHPVEIEIRQTGEIMFNRAKLSQSSEDSSALFALEQRLNRVMSLFPNLKVIIRPHADTRHEQVVQVVNACKAAKVKSLSFGESI